MCIRDSRLLAAGLYLQKTFAYSHEDKLCDSIGVVAWDVYKRQLDDSHLLLHLRTLQAIEEYQMCIRDRYI